MIRKDGFDGMEWRKSTLSGAELERKRKEYIEAAMKMSDRAQPASDPPFRTEKAEEKAAPPPLPEVLPGEESALKKEAEEIVFAEPEAPPSGEPAPKEKAEEIVPAEPETPQSEEPAPKEEAEEIAPAKSEKPEMFFQPELLHEPEPIEETEKKFGVFDVDELIDAVKKGEVDGEKLREASEILEEMSGKTEEMQKLAGQPNRSEACEPTSLSQSVRRHNGGNCPRCGQGNRNGTRR